VSGTRTNLLFGLLYDTGAVYIKLVYTRAGAVGTYYGIVRNYTETMDGKGQLHFAFNLAMVDIGSANPSWA
jgi:molybdopterin synthase catalytic subunit